MSSGHTQGAAQRDAAPVVRRNAIVRLRRGGFGRQSFSDAGDGFTTRGRNFNSVSTRS